MAGQGKRDQDAASLSNHFVQASSRHPLSEVQTSKDAPSGDVQTALLQLSQDDNFAWDPINNQLAVNVRSEGEDCFYARSSTQELRNALEQDTFTDAYWVAQAIHYGLPLTINRRAIKKAFRRQLQSNEGLTPPTRLLQLGFRLQDQSKDKRASEQEMVKKEVVKHEAESDNEPVLRQKQSRKEVDSDEDYVEGEDASDNSEDEASNSTSEQDDHVTAKEVQALEPARSPRLPRHPDRPVRSIEESAEQDQALSSEESEHSDPYRETPSTSVSKSRTRSSRRSAKSRKTRANQSGGTEQAAADLLSSPSFTRARTSKIRQNLSITLPDHLSDASEYLTAKSSSASNPNSATFIHFGGSSPPLAVRTARSTPVDANRDMGANLSKEVSSGEELGDPAQQSIQSNRTTDDDDNSARPLHFDNIPVHQRSSDSNIDHAVRQPTSSESFVSHQSQAQHLSVNNASPHSENLAATKPTTINLALGAIDPEQLSEEEQLEYVKRLSLSETTPAPPLPPATFVNDHYARIAPSNWQLDLSQIQDVTYIRDEIKSRLRDGQHTDREIDFCIQQAAGDPETSYRNYVQAANVRWLDPRPMSIHLRRKYDRPYKGGNFTLVDRYATIAQPGERDAANSRNAQVSAPVPASRPFDMSQIRPWVPVEDMDMGPVYRAGKKDDGFLVRTHEGIMRNAFPGNAYNEGQVRLHLQEQRYQSLSLPVPSRTRNDLHQRQLAERKTILCQKSAKTVSLQPVGTLGPVRDITHGEGNISYEGQSRISWQLRAVGALAATDSDSTAATTSAPRVTVVQTTDEPKTSAPSSSVALASDSPRQTESMDLDEPEPSTPAQPTSPATGRNSKKKKKSHGKRKRQDDGEERSKTDPMADFSAKAKRRKMGQTPRAHHSTVSTGGEEQPSDTTQSLSNSAIQQTRTPLESSPAIPTPVHETSNSAESASVQNTADKDATAKLSAQDTANSVAPDQEFKCGWQGCDKVAKAIDLHQHVRVVHVGYLLNGNSNLKCMWKDCERKLKSNETAVNHIYVHVPYRPHVCCLCGRGYTRLDILMKHVKDKHPDGAAGGVVPGPWQGVVILSRQQNPSIRAQGESSTAQTMDSDDESESDGDQDDGPSDARSVARSGDGSDSSSDGEADSSSGESTTSYPESEHSESQGIEPASDSEDSGDESEETEIKEKQVAVLTPSNQHQSRPEGNVEMDLAVRKQRFPEHRIPGKGKDDHYHRIIVRDRLRFAEHRLQVGKDVGQQNGQFTLVRGAVATLQTFEKARDEWQEICEQVEAGKMESPAHAQFRIGFEQRSVLAKKLKESVIPHQKVALAARKTTINRKIKLARKDMQANL